MAKEPTHAAFPTFFTQGGTLRPGMTLREWFAGLAMQGIIAANPDFLGSPEQIAESAFRVADEMLRLAGP